MTPNIVATSPTKRSRISIFVFSVSLRAKNVEY
jgi:hypothetical protein